MPRVTVIMPAYNHARFIGQAVSSVLGQSFEDLELLVVDDGSRDDTPQMLATFSDPVCAAHAILGQRCSADRRRRVHCHSEFRRLFFFRQARQASALS